MGAVQMLATAGLLGAYAFFGGAYAVCYAVSELQSRQGFLLWARLSYVSLLVCTTGLLLTPLAPLWKVFIVLSALAYYFVPPTTARYLRQLHDEAEVRS
jgi:hypothetical protein